METTRRILLNGALAAALAATLVNGCATRNDAIPQAEKSAKARPGLAETKAIAEEGFIYGLPIVMNYAVMNEFCATESIVRIIGEPTTPNEAANAVFYEHKINKQKFPRLQLRTVKELMTGKGIERPTGAATIEETFKKAPKSKKKHGEQEEPKM